MIDLKDEVWTVRKLMKSAIEYLQEKGFPESRLNVELLLANALQCKRIELYTNFEKPLTKQELAQFRSLFERRVKNEPVQYIIGSTMFMGLLFAVDQRALIPRPETETLVEQAVMACHGISNDRVISVLEVGTGSGNVAVSLAKFVKNVVVTTIDVSSEALELARQNISAHGVEEKVLLQRMDVFEPIDQLLRRRFDLFISNPPYVSLKEWGTLRPEIREFEPLLATSDGADGYELYKRFIEIAPFVLVDGGVMMFETGDEMATNVMTLMLEAGFSAVSTIRDLQGVERVVRGSCHTRVRNPISVN